MTNGNDPHYTKTIDIEHAIQAKKLPAEFIKEQVLQELHARIHLAMREHRRMEMDDTVGHDQAWFRELRAKRERIGYLVHVLKTAAEMDWDFINDLRN